MKNILPKRLAVLRATLSLLFQSNPRSFTISAIASLPEPLFFPAIVFLVQRLFKRLTDPRWMDDVHFNSSKGMVVFIWSHHTGFEMGVSPNRPDFVQQEKGEPS